MTATSRGPRPGRFRPPTSASFSRASARAAFRATSEQYSAVPLHASTSSSLTPRAAISSCGR
eukprot:CAMPEP_0113282392 /NCGR_PEP_ID=MMETSP0008_2-20120614/28841_1 /TAXON_ID=97485 /ORGANISM="Prymnesium parvum" /LENGTH=61 /DNA_ID=CAMNT_0000132935 /DNA_START=173 /DNA_END=358 /DNA_ORIENTATION=+ /assembly_acc=CAM_ASM_000153